MSWLLVLSTLALGPLGFARPGTRSPADCRHGDPQGLYRGDAVSQQSGRLEVTLNLRCVNGRYAGALVTPVGTFRIRGGGVEDDSLRLQFDAGEDVGQIATRVAGGRLDGRFAVSGDSGPLALRRVGEPRADDVPAATIALTPAAWRDDVEFFARELPRRHAAPFAHLSRARFRAEIAALERDLPRLTGDQVYVRLDQIANAIGDAHTFVALPADDPQLPLLFGRFGSDDRVVAAAPGLERALGTRLLAVQDTRVARVRSLLLRLTPAAETQALRDARVTDFLTLGLMLHGLGVTPRRDSARLLLATDHGKPFSLSLGTLSTEQAAALDWRYVFPHQPLYRERPDSSFWFTYLPASRTVYCAFRGYDQLATHAAALFAFVTDKRPEKLFIDMRQNGGGDFNEGLKYLIDPIRRSARLDRPGHLFIGTGVSTFSAGMSNAAQFRALTNAILVGDTIGERPNSYQEPRQMRLPNSHLIVRYSTRYYHFIESGPDLVVPDRPIATTWADYEAGRDPVLAWVEAVDPARAAALRLARPAPPLLEDSRSRARARAGAAPAPGVPYR